MAGLLRIVLTLALGIALGLGVTRWVVDGRPPFGAIASGPWVAWPDAGTPDADPYARAVQARAGWIPLAAAAGLRYVATTDTAGRPLEGRCSYLVEGPLPAAQFWTLTVLDPDGYPQTAGAGRRGFTSSEVVRGADGVAAMILSNEARPGNWLPIAGLGRFVAMLSLYDTPVGASLLAGNPPPALPGLTPAGCT